MLGIGKPISETMAELRTVGRSKEKRKTNMKGGRLFQWTDSLLSEDPLPLLSGSDQGGFLSLEEIDESAYEHGLLGEVVEAVAEEKRSERKRANRTSNEEGGKDKKKRKKNNRNSVVQGKEAARKKNKKTNQKEEGTSGEIAKLHAQATYLLTQPV